MAALLRYSIAGAWYPAPVLLAKFKTENMLVVEGHPMTFNPLQRFVVDCLLSLELQILHYRTMTHSRTSICPADLCWPAQGSGSDKDRNTETDIIMRRIQLYFAGFFHVKKCFFPARVCPNGSVRRDDRPSQRSGCQWFRVGKGWTLGSFEEGPPTQLRRKAMEMNSLLCCDRLRRGFRLSMACGHDVSV